MSGVSSGQSVASESRMSYLKLENILDTIEFLLEPVIGKSRQQLGPSQSNNGPPGVWARIYRVMVWNSS